MTKQNTFSVSDSCTVGEECLDFIEHSLKQRPKGTGITSHDYRPSDVIVTTFPKSGTTLTQYMAYQIVALSGGGPSFDRDGTNFPDLAVISPWLDYIPEIGIPPCESSPRILKTHSPVNLFSGKECRYLVVVRNPLSFPASWLDFVFEAMVPNSRSLSESDREDAFHCCVRRNILKSYGETGLGEWHNFVLKSIYPLSHNKLTLFYEDIVADMENSIRSIASFMNCELTNQDVKDVVRRCDRKKMAKDSRFCCKIESSAFGISIDMPKAKPERSDGFKKFKVRQEDKEQLEEMNKIAFGVRTYEEFKRNYKIEQRKFYEW